MLFNTWTSVIFLPAVLFVYYSLTWIFFWCQNFGDAWSYLSGIVSLKRGVPGETITWLAVASALMLAIDIPQYVAQNQTAVLRWPWFLRAASYATVVLAMFTLRSNGQIPFIYFQF